MKDYFGYSGKVCVVTGAASGMGKATAEMLVDLGAKVYALDISPIEVSGVEKAMNTNLGDKKSIDDTFKEIPETIDRYFGVAGISGVHHDFVKTITVNFIANKYITEEYLTKRIPDFGGIVFCTSSGGLGWEKPGCKEEYMSLIDAEGWDAMVKAAEKMAKEHPDTPGPMYYGLSKRAMNYYVAASLEKFASRKIRVNAVMPMGTDTGLRDDFASMAGDLESMIEFGTGLAKRLARPEEMAASMVFLNSDMASFLDGVLLSADYGMKLRIDAGIDPDMFSNPHFGASHTISTGDGGAKSQSVAKKKSKKRSGLFNFGKKVETIGGDATGLTIDSKVKELVSNPATAAIIDEFIPGMSSNSQLKMAYGLSLRRLCQYPQVGISPEKVEELAEALEKAGK